MIKILAIMMCSVGTMYGMSYSTMFPSPPAPESVLSEGGNWVDGGVVGLEWTNVQTVSGKAYGTMPGNASYGSSGLYADSTALMTGVWGSNQSCTGVVYVGAASNASSVYEEVELRLRMTMSADSITGYEVNASVSTNSANYYIQVNRWNGPIGSFTQLDGWTGHCVNGDILTAGMTGNQITVWLNNVQIMQVTDSTYNSGNPGIGFFLEGATGVNANYGFSSFSATDGVSGSPTPSPTPQPTPTPSPTASPTPAPYSVWESALLSELQSVGVNASNRTKVQTWMTNNPPTP
jgi:hypothetical protein